MLKSPTKQFIINQPFGANANTYYKEGGLKGHTGLDLHCSYGEEILSACDGYVYSVLNKDNPDLMRYRAVYVLVDLGDEAYELSYGHAKDILVSKGQYVKTGDVLITGGNTGDVASGGQKVTKEQKEAGSTAGTHLHFQLRELVKTKDKNYSNAYLYDGEKQLEKDGYYYFIKDIQNGYVGCIDPMPFFDFPPYENFPVLKKGSKGKHVEYMQALLLLHGYDIKVDGLFGSNTEKFLKTFQKSANLVEDGICGKLTFAKLYDLV